MKRRMLLLICLLAVTGVALSQNQAPDSLWSRPFGGSSHEVYNAVAATSDGGQVLAGWTRSFGSGWYDFWVTKTDVNGIEQWSRTYGGQDGEGAFAIEQTRDGGYLVAGITGSFGAGMADGWLVKLSATGDSLWSHTYGGDANDGCFALQILPDDNIVLAGFTESAPARGRDFWLLKVTADGSTVSWSKVYGGPRLDECLSLAVTPDGGFVLGGYTYSFGANALMCSNFWLVRTESDGDTLWTRAFGDDSMDVCYAVAAIPAGGFLMAGSTRSRNGRGEEDFMLLRTREDGREMWRRYYGGTGSDMCFALQMTSDTAFVAAGLKGDSAQGPESYDMWMIKADIAGNQVYQRSFGGADEDVCYGIRSTANGGFALAGLTRSFGTQYDDGWHLRTGADHLVTPPGAFDLTSPADDTTFGANIYSVTFRWTAAANTDLYDTVRYSVYVSTDPLFDGAATDTVVNLIGTSLAWNRVIVANQPNYWKVEAKDRSGWSTWSSSSRRFTVLGTAPAAFNLISPANGDTVLDSVGVRLSWRRPADPDTLDAQSYTIYISEDPTFSNPALIDSVARIADTTRLGRDVMAYLWTRGVQRGVVHYWRLKATDRHGLSAWSADTWSFVVRNALPRAFDLTTPGNNAVVSQIIPLRFRWTRAVDPDSALGDYATYCVHVSADSLFTTPLTVCNVVDTQLVWNQQVHPLNLHQYYWWKVIATDRLGYSTTSSNTLKFRISDPPNAFNLYSPRNLSVVTTPGDVRFLWWRAVDVNPGDVVTYCIYVSDTSGFLPLRTDSACGLTDTVFVLPGDSIVNNVRYYWKVKATDNHGLSRMSTETWSFSRRPSEPPGIELPDVPVEFKLAQNYPNPFNALTEIRYDLAEPGPVSVKIYDLLGRQIVTLVDQEQGAGSYKLHFDASDLPSGVYFLRMQTAQFRDEKKMLLLK